MKKGLILLPLFFLFGFVNTYAAEPSEWTKALYESVRFAQNGNDIIVDINQVKVSLENGANPNWITGQRKTSIISRWIGLIGLSNKPKIINDGLEIIKLLFEKNAKLQFCDRDILGLPIRRGQAQIVKILLENGASAKRIYTDKTPIEIGYKAGNPKVIELLINYGATPFSEKKVLGLRLIVLARNREDGSLYKIQELLNKGAYINASDSDGETAITNAVDAAFHIAPSCYGDYCMLNYLIKSGANINHKTKDTGKTPLHTAISRTAYIFKTKMATVRPSINQWRVKEGQLLAKMTLGIIIDAGAYVSATDKWERTPLHTAAKVNNVVGAKMLIEAGAKIMPKDKDGKTPLDYAESAEIIKLLKAHGAKEQ